MLALHMLSAIIIRSETMTVSILHVIEISLSPILFYNHHTCSAPNKDITLRPCQPNHFTAFLISQILTDLEIIEQ
jgi:hypothetical protein